jgi:hypothetical protein
VPLDDNDQRVIAEIAARAAVDAVERRMEQRPSSATTNGVPMPPSNASDALAVGPEVDLSNWRRMIRNDTFVEKVDATGTEIRRAQMAMIQDALRRHQANHATGRSDLMNEASFFGR